MFSISADPAARPASAVTRLPRDVVADAVARYPTPVADAVAALDAADNPHQRRDRVVELFRTVVRYNAALALAARVQFGAPASGDPADLADLLRSLRRRHLTDGQWIQITRALLRPWAERPEAHPLTDLVIAMCGPKGRRAALAKPIDGLLEMRRTETVAHGGTGGAGDIDKVLERRMPQLLSVLETLAPVWDRYRLCVPLDATDDRRGWLLVGFTPAHRRWRRVELSSDVELEPGKPILVDSEGVPIVALHPVAVLTRPSPEVTEELFVLDGGGRRGTRYVAFPSMAEHREGELWPALEPLLAGDDDDDEEAVAGIARPYRGLLSFTAEHSRLFFGRKRELEELSNRVRRHPFVTVTGGSGTGKSSLLHAGVFPRLGDHQLIDIRPGHHPTHALAVELDRVLGPEPDDRGGRSFVEILQGAPETLGTVLQRRGVAVVLAVDQGEEMFTRCSDDEDRERFAAALASAGADPDGRVRVVLSLREDFFARLATVEPLRGLYSRHIEVVTTPDRDALVRTLIAPASAFGYRFEDAALIDEMVDPVVGEPAALALLQFCADKLWDARDRKWKRLTRAAYHDLGGVEGALAAHADRTLDRLTPAQQRAARLVLLRLVTPDGTRAAVCRAELVAAAGDRDGADAVVDALVEQRLLITRESDEDEGDAVELVHEALIRHWDRLRGWLDEDREMLIVRHRVAGAAAHWQSEGSGGDLLLGDGKPLEEAQQLLAAHPELLADHELSFIDASRARVRRRARLVRLAIAGLVVLAAAASIAAFLAVKSSERAQQREREVAARSDDLVLLRASEALEEDPAAALAWLASLEVTPRTATRARLIAAEAVDAGTTTSLVRFSIRAPLQFRLDGDRLRYLASNMGVYVRSLSGAGEREQLSKPRDPGFTRWSIDPEWRSAMFVQDGKVEVVDLSSGTSRTLPLGDREAIEAVASADGSTVAIIERSAAVAVIDVRTGNSRRISDGPLDPRSPLFALTPDGKRLVWVHADGSGKIVDLATDERREIAAPERAVKRIAATKGAAAALSPDGKTLFIVDVDGFIRTIDVATAKTLRVPGGAGPATVARYTPDGRHLLTVHDKRIQVWAMPQATVAQVMRSSTRGVVRVELSDDGKSIAAGTENGDIYVWRRFGEDTWKRTARDAVVLRGHRDVISALAFSADASELVSTSFDNDLRRWRLPSGDASTSIGAVDAPDGRLQFTANGLVASGERRVEVRSLAGEPIARWPPGTPAAFDLPDLPPLDGSAPTRLVLSTDGSIGVVLDGGVGRLDVLEGEVTRLSNLQGFTGAAVERGDMIALFSDKGRGIVVINRDGEELARLEGSAAAPNTFRPRREIVFSPDGRWLVETHEVGTVRRWRTATWSEVPVTRTEDRLGSPVFSPDGDLLAIPIGKSIRVWSLADESHRDLTGSQAEPRDLVFSGDGKTLVSLNSEPLVRIWNPRTGTGRALATGMRPTSAALSADGSTVALLGGDFGATLYDLESEQRRRLRSTNRSLRTIAISADGERVAATANTGAIYLWERTVPSEPKQLDRFIDAASVLRLDPRTGELMATAGD